jgi:hypothetical protein
MDHLATMFSLPAKISPANFYEKRLREAKNRIQQAFYRSINFLKLSYFTTL